MTTDIRASIWTASTVGASAHIGCNSTDMKRFRHFAAGVLVAHVAGAPQGSADLLAVTFCIARIVYGLLYLANKAAMRSLVWFIGICAVVGLFVISA